MLPPHGRRNPNTPSCHSSWSLALNMATQHPHETSTAAHPTAPSPMPSTSVNAVHSGGCECCELRPPRRPRLRQPRCRQPTEREVRMERGARSPTRSAPQPAHACRDLPSDGFVRLVSGLAVASRAPPRFVRLVSGLAVASRVPPSASRRGAPYCQTRAVTNPW